MHTPPDFTYDAVILGGGPAGLSAALMLGRACRRVLVCDAGAPRNAPAPHSHGFFTRDGAPPLELLRLGRADLARYPEVSVRDVAIVDAERLDEGFAVTLEGGEVVTTRGLIVASGVRDLLPETPGFRQLWGTGVFHCPFCHGWEVRDQPLAVYGQDMYALHMVYIIKAWTSDVMLLSDGPLVVDDAQRDKLARNGIVVNEGVIAALEGDEQGLQRVCFADGTRVARRGLMFSPPNEPGSRLPEKFGVELGEHGRPVLNPFYQTSVPGLFMAGDAGTGMPTLLLAASSGAMAGAGLSNTLALLDAERA